MEAHLFWEQEEQFESASFHLDIRQPEERVGQMKMRLQITGEERIVDRFALFPIKANNEVRWLEKVKIHQSYNTDRAGWNNDWFE